MLRPGAREGDFVVAECSQFPIVRRLPFRAAALLQSLQQLDAALCFEQDLLLLGELAHALDSLTGLSGERVMSAFARFSTRTSARMRWAAIPEGADRQNSEQAAHQLFLPEWRCGPTSTCDFNNCAVLLKQSAFSASPSAFAVQGDVIAVILNLKARWFNYLGDPSAALRNSCWKSMS